MECSKVRIKLDEYIKGRLDDHTSSEIACHIENCKCCSDEMSMIREINDLLAIECPAYPETDFTSHVMDLIDREREGIRGFIHKKIPLINLGASLILTGMLTIFINTPAVNNLIGRYTKEVINKAAAVNMNIGMTTGRFQTYIKNIFYPGGEL